MSEADKIFYFYILIPFGVVCIAVFTGLDIYNARWRKKIEREDKYGRGTDSGEDDMQKHTERAIFLLLRLINEKLDFRFNHMEGKMSELSDAVAAVKTGQAGLDTGIGNLVTGLQNLETALANAGQPSPDVAQAVTDLKAVAADIATQSANVATALASIPAPPTPPPAPTGATGA